MNYLIVLAFVAIIMGIALFVTLLITKDKDKEYSGAKSITDQVWLYIALTILLVLVGLVFWFFK